MKMPTFYALHQQREFIALGCVGETLTIFQCTVVWHFLNQAMTCRTLCSDGEISSLSIWNIEVMRELKAKEGELQRSRLSSGVLMGAMLCL